VALLQAVHQLVALPLVVPAAQAVPVALVLLRPVALQNNLSHTIALHQPFLNLEHHGLC
jgi:hypothetical protein